MTKNKQSQREEDLNLKSLSIILEISYCIEAQFEPDTRLLLMVSGLISWNGEKPPYQKWVEGLYYKSIKFCKREKLI